MTDHGIPYYLHFMWPVLEALRELGGSARNREMLELVAEREAYTEKQRSVAYPHNPSSLVLDDRMGFARSALKRIGALENSARGVWALTRLGRDLTEDRMLALHKEAERHYRSSKRQRDTAKADDASDPEDLDDQPSDRWKEQLLECLSSMSPSAFEHLAQRLLREACFLNVEVLGKSGDGGLDGAGVYRPSLVSFPVYFQCKRYRGPVSAGAVRDFRGAMVGRSNNGLLITTGSFTRGARQEATRDGAPPIDLVDGEELCQLLKKYGLGVKVTERVIEEIEVDLGFFDQF